ncbi:MAG: hypothetical protein FD150_2275, partial [Rhodobacteraceae bacterium]
MGKAAIRADQLSLGRDSRRNQVHQMTDQIDHRILKELQADARISHQELSERVGLSPSPC